MFGDSSIEISFSEAYASSSSSSSSKSNNNNNASNSRSFDDSDSGRRSYHEEISYNSNGVGDSHADLMTYQVNYRGVDASSQIFTFVAPLTTEVSSSRCAEMLSASTFSSNHDAIYERMDVPADKYSLRSPFNKSATLQAPCFAPGTLASILGSAGKQTSNNMATAAPQPPLIPAVTLNTIFTCHRQLEDIVHTVSSVFDYFGDNMSAQYSANEFTWHCNFISEGHQHVNFLVKIYRYSKRHELCGSFAIEFQRLEGDRLPYMNAYNACRDLLTTSDFGDAYDYFNQSFYGQDGTNSSLVGFSSVLDCSATFGTALSVPSMTAESEEQSKNLLKDSIVKQLSVQATYNNLLENIQMISSLYASTSSLSNSNSVSTSPSKAGSAVVSAVDAELFLALCDVARKYSSNSRDWVYQHSIIAIADMLCLFEKCGCCSGFMSSLKGQESVVSLLRSMAGVRDDNCFVSSKSEQISKMISLIY